MGFPSPKCQYLTLCIFAGITITAAIVFGVVLLRFDSIVTSKLNKALSLTPTSLVFTNWRAPETDVFFSIWLYNITNAEDVLTGNRPKLMEIGPYVYKEKRMKHNITFNEDNTVTYNQSITYIFIPEKSFGDVMTDKITGVNLPVAALSSQFNKGKGPGSMELTMLTMMANMNLFITKTAHQHIWGYKNQVTYVCHTMSPEKCPTSMIGIMYGKNGTEAGPFTVNTGVGDIRQLGQVQSYANKDSMSAWSSTEANMINGTDGSLLAPGITEDSQMYVFSADVCRSFKMSVTYTTHAKHYSRLKLFGLGGDPNTLAHVSKHPSNRGFCTPAPAGPECPPEGFIDLSNCKGKKDSPVPIFTSQPRFFGADQEILDAVEGIPKATKELCQTTVHVEPTTGLVLEAKKRLQVNIFVNASEQLSDYFVNFTTPTFVPIAWFEEAAEADAETLEELYLTLFEKPRLARLLLICLFVGLMLIFLFCFIILFCMYRRRDKKLGKTPISDTLPISRKEYSVVSMQTGEEAVSVRLVSDKPKNSGDVLRESNDNIPV